MLSHILSQLKGTREYDVLCEMEKVYSKIETSQETWKKASNISCPEFCGKCCVLFEPDINKSEALYLAAWLIENQPKVAGSILAGTFKTKKDVLKEGCILFDPDNKYHCTVYGGRCLICRLFGFSGDYGRHGEHRWKPCKFMPAEILEHHLPALEHRQYEENELKKIFSALPPIMSDFTEQAIALDPNEAFTFPLRDALPKAIEKIEFLLYAARGKDPEDPSLPLTT